MFFTQGGITASQLTPATSVAPSLEQSKPLRELYEELPSSTQKDIRPLQRANAYLPILLTLAGITTDASPMHPENALDPMLSTPWGIITDFSPSHPLNA